MSPAARCALFTVVATVIASAPALPATGAASVLVGVEEVSFGSLELDLPSGWVRDPSSPDGTLVLRPPGERQFVVQVTPLPDLQSTSPKERCARAESLAEESRGLLGPVAEQGEIPIRRLDGPGICLRFISVTDATVKKPSETEFKYGTQGALATGQLVVTFTILSNREDAPEHGLALDMLRGARHRDGPVEPTATAGAATQLRYPGKDWAMQVDFRGFEMGPPEYGKDGQALRFIGEGENIWLTIFYERADRGDDPEAYRRYYREASFSAAPLQREDIREWERDGMVLLGYTNLFEGHRFHNVNAFWVRDGLWIDVHLSTGGDRKHAMERFDRFLDSIRFVEMSR